MLKTLQSLQGVSVLSKEAQKKVNGGGTCGVVNRFADGGRCVEDYGISRSEAIDGMNQLYQDIQQDNGEGNWWGASGAGYCCASCGKMAKCTG